MMGIGILIGLVAGAIGLVVGLVGAFVGIVAGLLGLILGASFHLLPVVLIALGIIWLVKPANSWKSTRVATGHGAAPSPGPRNPR